MITFMPFFTLTHFEMLAVSMVASKWLSTPPTMINVLNCWYCRHNIPECGYIIYSIVDIVYPIVDKTYTQLWIFRIGYTGSLLISYFPYFRETNAIFPFFLLDLLVGSLGILYTQLWISTIGYTIYPIVDLMHNSGYAQLLNLSPIQKGFIKYTYY